MQTIAEIPTNDNWFLLVVKCNYCDRGQKKPIK